MKASVSRLKQLLLSMEEKELVHADLEPDGRYQLHGTTAATVTAEVIKTLAHGFDGRRPEEFPVLVVGWGKCRVGSTALTNLFGVAGVRSYYQPVKTIARHVLVGGEGAAWTLPPAQRVLFAKEMAGPYVHYETIFNPIECLIQAGWPADRLHLLILDREPRASLNSWINKWEGRIGEERVRTNFELSTLNYARMRRYARDTGVTVTSFPYEASRTPEWSISRLFDRLGLAHLYADSILSNWGARGDLNSDAAMMVYPVEPEPYIVAGLHGSGDGYQYRPPSDIALSEQAEELAAYEPVRQAYETSVRDWAQQSGAPQAVRDGILALPRT